MSAQKFVQSSLAFVFALTAAGAAFADQPTRVGYRDSIVEDACTPAFASGASYRDAVARTGTQTSAVLVAKGSEGYRNAFASAPAQTGARQVALGAALVCRN
jgi:hypothetical protein